MSWVIFFFGSGLAFFAGMALVLAGVAVASVRHGRGAALTGFVAAFSGVLLVGLSATPLPYWYYGLAGAVSVIWLVAERWKRLERGRRWLRAGVAALCAGGIAVELPYHLSPALPAGD